MKFILFFAKLVLCLSVQAFALSVEFRDEQPNNQSILALRTRIVNEDGCARNNIKIRYVFIKKANKEIVLDSGYTAIILS